VNPARHLQTGRLLLRPVSWRDLRHLISLKGDPRAYAPMLGGVRPPLIVAEELAEEVAAWSSLGYGMFAIHTRDERHFIGVTGLQNRPDGRGVGLRFALMPEQQGQGFAAEAASAALRFGHERCGLQRIVAVAREDNIGSRQVLGAIGMIECARFIRDGVEMLVFESVKRQHNV
jgi:RimJ/RimL family protein N-acetyltransferase